MNNVLIFAGTTEGRILSEYLSDSGLNIHVCVATEYGSSILPKGENITVSSKRLDIKEMETLILSLNNPIVVDATHPHAAIVSENIKEACGNKNVKLIRLIRDEVRINEEDCLYFSDLDSVIEFLKQNEGKVLATTGSKELKKYTDIKDYKSRIFARVLSTKESTDECIKLGFEGENLICMQGPFSEEFNYGLLTQLKCKYMVTKESGKTGGFSEKINAAKRAGVKCLVIGRPLKEDGLNLNDCKEFFNKEFSLKTNKKISLIGIGMGNLETMTLDALNALKEADVIIGAKRMVRAAGEFEKPVFETYKNDEIEKFIMESDEYKNFAVVMSGDIGFCSGAKKIIDSMKTQSIKLIPGISTVSYISSKAEISWDDMVLLSTHGKDENVIHQVNNNEKVFLLLGGEKSVVNLCEKLIKYNLEEVVLYVGENLSYPEEKITKGTPKELLNMEFGTLSAVIIKNENFTNEIVTHGLADSFFIRDKAPMTKEEIRSISLSKLMLTKDSVIYDVGAGTGSVSIEMALRAYKGRVYAIEKNESSVELINKNKEKFKTDNLETILSLAPEGLEDLPAPTHAFIGGSSGKIAQIIDLLIAKNPKVRIVINALTLETISEIINYLNEKNISNPDIVQVSVSKSKKLGRYNMMEGTNPIYIISFNGC